MRSRLSPRTLSYASIAAGAGVRPVGRGRRLRRGLTLIEITITVAVIGLIAAMSVVGIQALSANALRSASIELSGVIKSCYDRSIMEKRIQRVSFDLDEETWWVEYTADPYALDVEVLSQADDPDEPEELYLDEEAPEDLRQALEGSRAAGFQADEFFGGKHRLPDGVHYGRLWTGMRDEPFEKGIIYLHFFRGGFTEPLQIELFDGSEEDREDREYTTLKVRPLTGRVRMYQRQLDAPEDDRRPWEEDD